MVYFSVWHSFRFFHNYIYIEASKSASKDKRMRKRAIIHTREMRNIAPTNCGMGEYSQFQVIFQLSSESWLCQFIPHCIIACTHTHTHTQISD